MYQLGLHSCHYIATNDEKKDLLSGLDYMHLRKLSIPANGGIGMAIIPCSYPGYQARGKVEHG